MKVFTFCIDREDGVYCALTANGVAAVSRESENSALGMLFRRYPNNFQGDTKVMSLDWTEIENDHAPPRTVTDSLRR